MNNSKLANIRAQIDEIDSVIHAKLIERAQLISALQQAKTSVNPEQGSLAMRPAREAQMMRALYARHQGPLPLLAIEHIWREIISAFTQMQAPYRVSAVDLRAQHQSGTGSEIITGEQYADGSPVGVAAVERSMTGFGSEPSHQPRASVGALQMHQTERVEPQMGHRPKSAREIIRYYFGVMTPMEIGQDAGTLLAHVSGDARLVGVVLTSADSPAGAPAWWRDLATGDAHPAHIVGRLPLVPTGTADGVFDCLVWIVSQAPFDPSGHDVTLFGVKGDGAELGQALQDRLGVSPDACCCLGSTVGEDGTKIKMMAVAGYHAQDTVAADPRIAHMGGYAVLGG